MAAAFYAIAFSFMILAWFLARLVQDALVDKLTAVNDLVLLGKARLHGRKVQGTAVISGASIAGLLAARICSDHFESVLIVEPESGLDDVGHGGIESDAESQLKLRKRSRVPQYTAPHAYQVLTYRALKKLFPNFEDCLISCGGRILPADMRVHISGRSISPPPQLVLSNMTMYISRHLYESLLRRLVSLSCHNIRFIDGSITDVVPGGTKSGPLKSVVIRTKGSESDTVEAAALVVDCTGPTQAGLKWLENAGYALLPSSVPKPATLRTTYNPKFNGTSCHFRVTSAVMRGITFPGPENFQGKIEGAVGGYDRTGCLYLYIPDPRQDIRNFLIQWVEGDWLQIVCSGYDIPDRPMCVSDVISFVSKTKPAIPIPSYIFELLNALDDPAIPTAWHYIRVPPLSFVRYHEACELPSNFVALGDAVCQLNPIHGQGVTMSTICAITLNAALASDINASQGALSCTFSSRFFVQQASRLRATWDANKGDDYGYNTTTPAQGEDRSHGWFRRWYSVHLAVIASRDEDIATVLWYIENFLRPGTDVFSPYIVGKVMWSWFVGGAR